jgi:hypothetical protein
MEIQTSWGFTDPVGQELERYWDIDQAAAFPGISRGELWGRAERGCVPAHTLRHEGSYCWKFRPSELVGVVSAERIDRDRCFTDSDAQQSDTRTERRRRNTSVDGIN